MAAPTTSVSADRSANHDRRPWALIAAPTTTADHVDANRSADRHRRPRALIKAPTTTVDHER